MKPYGWMKIIYFGWEDLKSHNRVHKKNSFKKQPYKKNVNMNIQ